MRNVEWRAKESWRGRTWKRSRGQRSTKPDYDTDYLDEASASGVIHWVTAIDIVEVRYESGLVDVTSRSKPSAGVQGRREKVEKGRKLVDRNGVAKQYGKRTNITAWWLSAYSKRLDNNNVDFRWVGVIIGIGKLCSGVGADQMREGVIDRRHCL